VRKARFDDGEAKKETTRTCGYLLERGDGQAILSFAEAERQECDDDRD
jgi:hypothetical protein